MIPEPPRATGRWDHVKAALVGGVLRASLLVSPRPTALVVRKVFARSGEELAAALAPLAPHDVVSVIDERYDAHPDAVLDVYAPAAAAREGAALPTVVWTHGGGFVGGSKEELSVYLRLLAADGFTVVAPRYTLAPEASYPSPLAQVMAALRHVQQNAAQLNVDPSKLVLAGDSAGAQITAQLAILATDPAYAEELGVESTIAGHQLRGVLLCCGVYDLRALARASTSHVVAGALWAYSGNRRYREDERFLSTATVLDHVTASFPPAFVTVGNADPLLGHSTALVAALQEKAVEVDTLIFQPDHEPPLSHEYQFQLDLAEAREARARIVTFIRRCSA